MDKVCEREGIKQNPDEENQGGPLCQVEKYLFFGIASFQPVLQGEKKGKPHDEQKKRENQVGGGATGPCGMAERWIDGGPVAGGIHDDHGNDRETPEGIQRNKTVTLRHRKGDVLRHKIITIPRNTPLYWVFK